ncbi:MAG: fasciclin domain-containing protein [Cryomorphaceae bacterium]|nr:fasciclin domain-containing protein [Flavobacteriales bacterium]
MKKMLLSLAVTVFTFSAVQAQTIWEIIQASEDHTTLEAAIEAAELDGVLNNPEANFTVFAPTDAAFALLGGAVGDLLDDPNGGLTNTLLYHVVGGTALSTDLSDGMEINTAQGETVLVTITGGNVLINDAEVTGPDIEADNGVVHVIDAVLLPTLCTQGLSAVNNFVNAGGAPAPDENGVCEVIEFTAFGVWAGEIYPVPNIVEGTEYTFSICDGFGAGSWDATLIVQNLATGAVIASVDGCDITWTAGSSDDIGIIIQEVGTCGTTSDNSNVDNGSPSLTCTGEVVELGTVVDIIVNSPDHTILEDLVILAGLDGVLSGEGPFTVFAPTDEAFGNVDQATLDALTADPEGLLTQVLTYHVVPGAVFSGDLTDGLTAATVNGEEVTFGVGAVVTVGNANVTATVTGPDLEASNGVVHVINEVLVPTTLSVDHIASLGSLNIFPNPTNQQFTVDVNLVNSERVSIDLVNLVGQNVKSIDLGNRSSGLNREYIDVSGLPTGFYLMNITVGDSQVVTKVQVVR